MRLNHIKRFIRRKEQIIQSLIRNRTTAILFQKFIKKMNLLLYLPATINTI